MLILLTALSTISTLVAVGLFIYVIKRHKSALGVAFSGFSLALALWSGPSSFQFMTDDPDTLVTLSKIAYMGIMTIAPAWFVFIAIYTDDVAWISDSESKLRQRVLLLFVPSLFFMVTVFTNESHRLFWVDHHFTQFHGTAIHTADYGVVFWMHTTYAFALLLYTTTLLLRAGANAVRFQQIQATRIIVASLLPWFANVLVLTRSNPLYPVDLTPMTFAGSAILVVLVVLRDGTFKRVTMARDVIIESMNDGVIVMDMDSLIVDVNPAAVTMLQIEPKRVIGMSFNTAMQKHPDILECYDLLLKTHVQRDEARLLPNRRGTDVQVTFSPVNNRVGRVVGGMVILQNISERKKAQEEASRRSAYMDYLRQTDVRISSTLDISDVLEIGLDAAVIMSGADAGFISLIKSEGNKQEIVRTWGNYPEALENHIFPVTMGIVGRVVRRQEAELIHSVKDDPDYYPDIPSTVAQMTMPLMTHESTIGVLNLETQNRATFQPEVFDVIKLLAARLAVALENANFIPPPRNNSKSYKSCTIKSASLRKSRRI